MRNTEKPLEVVRFLEASLVFIAFWGGIVGGQAIAMTGVFGEWCPRPESNRYALGARDFKSLVSTYSTTRAHLLCEHRHGTIVMVFGQTEGRCWVYFCAHSVIVL